MMGIVNNLWISRRDGGTSKGRRRDGLFDHIHQKRGGQGHQPCLPHGWFENLLVTKKWKVEGTAGRGVFGTSLRPFDFV